MRSKKNPQCSTITVKDSRIQWLTVHEHAQHQEGVESSNLRQLQRYSTRKAHTLENLEAMFEAQMVCVCVCVCVLYSVPCREAHP